MHTYFKYLKFKHLTPELLSSWKERVGDESQVAFLGWNVWNHVVSRADLSPVFEPATREDATQRGHLGKFDGVLFLTDALTGEKILDPNEVIIASGWSGEANSHRIQEIIDSAKVTHRVCLA